MWLLAPNPKFRLFNYQCLSCRLADLSKLFYSIETKYSNEEREKIINTLNEADKTILSRYEITKGRIKQFSQWKSSNGSLNTLSDVELIEGFSEKTAKKLFDSILRGPVQKEQNVSNKIKGQILQPFLSPAVVKDIKSVLTVYITVNSVSWVLINKANYEVIEWKYQKIDYPEKKLQITDILENAWEITNRLPRADVYVMKAEATSLRAAGSDPNNPKVLSVNLQKAQMVAMVVALINARDARESKEDDTEESGKLKHRVYFLRPTLPFRLYGTLVGNERVSTDQTVEMLLRTEELSKPHIMVPETLKAMFRSQKDLEKDMLGQCLLLSLTFMDLCVYKDEVRITKLLEKRK